MSNKKLYYVNVEMDYYCVAENRATAERMCDDIVHDLGEPFYVYASEITSDQTKCIEKEWLNALLYGEDRDITLKQWLAEKAENAVAHKKKEELDSFQGKLF